MCQNWSLDDKLQTGAGDWFPASVLWVFMVWNISFGDGVHWYLWILLNHQYLCNFYVLIFKKVKDQWIKYSLNSVILFVLCLLPESYSCPLLGRTVNSLAGTLSGEFSGGTEQRGEDRSSRKTGDWWRRVRRASERFTRATPAVHQSTAATAGARNCWKWIRHRKRADRHANADGGGGSEGLQLHYFRKLIFQGVKVFPSLYNYKRQFPFLK